MSSGSSFARERDLEPRAPTSKYPPTAEPFEEHLANESEEETGVAEATAAVVVPGEETKTRCVGVIARDAKIVRRLCEFFEEAGLSARGFVSARTALDIASHQHFQGFVVEERLDELDAQGFASRIAAKLGLRAPRIVVLARPESTFEEPAISALVRAPATPAAILETLRRCLEEPLKTQHGPDDAATAEAAESEPATVTPSNTEHGATI